nr:heparin lyase I family protein [Motilibacter deserti]
MRVELRPYESTAGRQDGDVTDTGGYLANRAEVYGRTPLTPMSTTPAEQWPDPVGAERWYTFSLYVPADFQAATDATWLTLTQWKGFRGSSPPLALEIKRNNLRLGGARTNSLKIPNDGNLGAIARGSWTELTVGMRLSTDPMVGWVEVRRDGKPALARTNVATMDTYTAADGSVRPDPLYLKQGIYRANTWPVTHVLYFGPVVVADRAPATTPSSTPTPPSGTGATPTPVTPTPSPLPTSPITTPTATWQSVNGASRSALLAAGGSVGFSLFGRDGLPSNGVRSVRIEVTTSGMGGPVAVQVKGSESAQPLSAGTQVLEVPVAVDGTVTLSNLLPTVALVSVRTVAYAR